jgi:mycothiol synthase
VPDPSVVEVSPTRFSEVTALVARIDEEARALDGHPALGDAIWLDLEHPRPDSAGFLYADRAYAHVAPAENAGRADAGPREWSLGVALSQAARGNGTRVALVTAAADHVARHGGGTIALWLLGADADDDTDLAAASMRPDRELFEMRVPLPLAESPKWPADVEVRTFEPGRDEAAWIEVNNRAFAGHAEQGGWTAETFARRAAEPWFDPTLFLLAFDAAGLAGFNWLKVHPSPDHDAHDADPKLGEIYVVGVDPRAQGTGLGRALAVGGLQAVHERGIDTGMLFCAADNEPALKLYRSLGFTVHRTDRAYERKVAPT